ncbi:MAG: hypothetical protein LBK12_08200, partial [Odoribacteraceae bacterium]|nr:hypothetical protein [Odoribacteraceae bacterium]
QISGAPTRAGCPKRVLEVFRLGNGRLWEILGTVSPGGRELFVVWKPSGKAYVCDEREERFDLIFT